MLNLNDFQSFDENRYARHLVLKTDNMEVLVVCWMPGQGTAIHGHGPTDGVVVVLEGEIRNLNIHPDGHQEASVWRKGDILHTPVGFRHQMTNQSAEKCITLHIYAPPLAPEYLNPDLGYSNEVRVKEIQLPDEMVRYIMACPSRLREQMADPSHMI